MQQTLLSVLSALAICLPASASLSPLLPRVPGSQGTVLRPIASRDLGAAAGLQRRAAEEFSNLDLQTQSQLIYGNAGGMNERRYYLTSHELTLHSRRPADSGQHDAVRPRRTGDGLDGGVRWPHLRSGLQRG